jgi:hypothetical protein
MSEFYRLIRFLISMTGFLVVAAVVLANGDALFTAAVRSALTFAVLWIVLGLLQSVLSIVAGPNPGPDPIDVEQR